MLLIVLAAAFGATGAGGPLSDAEATTPDGVLRLSYERFQRHQADTVLRIAILRPPAESADGTFELRLGRALFDAWRIERIEPVPDSVATGPQGSRLRFRLSAEAGRTGGTAASGPPRPLIAVHARALRPLAAVTAEVSAGAGPPARLAMFVWP